MKHCTRFPSFNGPDYSKPIEIGHFFIVMHPALFQAISAFNASVSALVGELRRQRAKANAAVRASSDLEKAEAKEREQHGIPLDAVTCQEFQTLGERYGCALRALPRQ